MMIRTYDSDYIVIRHVQSGSVKDVYICRRNGEQSGREYTVICVKNVDACQKLLDFFSREVDTRKFTDFVECFTYDGDAYFVFFHSHFMTLTEKLASQNCLFAERLRIAYRILERIVYLNMPPVFVHDALQAEHVTVSDALDVCFNYELPPVAYLNDYMLQEAGEDISKILTLLFRRELERMSCPELERMLEWLDKGDYKSFLDIFDKFRHCYDILKKKTEEEAATPRTKPFQLWEKVKKVLVKLRKLLMAALIVAAVVYLVISVADLLVPKGNGDIPVVDRFDRIGTLNIPNENDPDAEEPISSSQEEEEDHTSR